MLGLVTQTTVYHWSIEGKDALIILFEYHAVVLILFCYLETFKLMVCISLVGESEPVKVFERTANLANNQIINYRCDPSEKWLVLIGIAPGVPEVCCYVY